MPTTWGYGDHGLDAGTMTGWGYPGGRTVLVLVVADTLVVTDAISTDLIASLTLALSEVFDIADEITLVIPSWLRKVYVGDNVYYIKIIRIR